MRFAREGARWLEGRPSRRGKRNRFILPQPNTKSGFAHGKAIKVEPRMTCVLKFPEKGYLRAFFDGKTQKYTVLCQTYMRDIILCK